MRGIAHSFNAPVSPARMTASHWAAAIIATCLLASCATTPTQPREELDESSGSTLLIVQHPIVLARARIDVAAHARDYVTLVGTEEDRSGRYTAWLVAHRWSTVDPRMGGLPDGPASLHIIADDREIDLQRAEPPPGFLHRDDLLYTPRGSATRTDAYAIDDATLLYIAGSHRLVLRIGESDPLPSFTLWEDGREALKQLLVLVPRARR